MKKIKAILTAALMMTGVSITSVQADSSQYSGPYIGLFLQANGLALDGSYNDSNSQLTTGSAGSFFAAGGTNLGWNLPIGEVFLIGIDATYIPGDAKWKGDVGEGDASHASSGDVTFEIADHMTLAIRPMISTGDGKSLYFKAGIAHADLLIKGDVKDPPSSFEGVVYAIGSRNLYGDGFFIETEAGMTIYDQLTLKGGGNTVNGTLKGDPELAYGRVTMGIQF